MSKNATKEFKPSGLNQQSQIDGAGEAFEDLVRAAPSRRRKPKDPIKPATHPKHGRYKPRTFRLHASQVEGLSDFIDQYNRKRPQKTPPLSKDELARLLFQSLLDDDKRHERITRLRRSDD